VTETKFAENSVNGPADHGSDGLRRGSDERSPPTSSAYRF
jgi:hypothetical protein